MTLLIHGHAENFFKMVQNLFQFLDFYRIIYDKDKQPTLYSVREDRTKQGEVLHATGRSLMHMHESLTVHAYA